MMEFRGCGIRIPLFRIQPCQMHFGIVLWFPAKDIGRTVVCPSPIVGRHAEQNGAAKHRNGEDAFDKPDKTLITQSGGKHAVILRLWLTGSNCDTSRFNAEFLKIEPRQRLAERLGHTIKCVGPDADRLI